MEHIRSSSPGLKPLSPALWVYVSLHRYTLKRACGERSPGMGGGVRLSGQVPMPTEYPPQRAEQMS